MLCYIKDMKTFETLSKFDTTEYSLADGENGQVTIYQKNAIELTTKYVGMWLIINQELFYISGATPNDDSIDLIIQSPIYAFYRQVEYAGETTYGALIKNIIDNNFGINCTDSEYCMSYVTVTNTDNTACEVETDDYGFVIPYEIFDDALYDGVAIDFSFTNRELNIAVYTANYGIAPIVFNDGQTTLESESYDPNFIAKITVLHRLPSPEPEEGAQEESEEEILYESIDYYLSADNHISTSPPEYRAKGIWKYYTAEIDDDPMSVAVGAFSHNNDNHKIEFHSPKKLHLYQKIKMRLRNELFSTIITSRVLSSEDSRYYYKCGNLATTLTEKIYSENSEVSSEIRVLKKRISIIANEGEEEVVPIEKGGTGADNVEDAIANLGFDSGASYCKLPDGTLIQWGAITITSGTTSVYVSPLNLFRVYLQFPIPFVSTGYNVFGSGQYSSGGATPVGQVQGSETSTSCQVHWWDAAARTFSTSIPLAVKWCAIGRWK